jgi:hypothetical protein
MPERQDYGWKLECDSALNESDRDKALHLLERALLTLEKRCAEWANGPGTEEELASIRNTILALKRRFSQLQK